MFKGWSVDLLRVLFLTIGTVIVAAVSADIYLASAIIFPVVFALFIFDRKPSEVTRVSIDMPERGWVGEEFDLTCSVYLKGKSGIMNLELKLPDQFDIRDGNNVHVFYKKRKSDVFKFEMKLRSMRRGTFSLSSFRYSSYASAGDFRKQSKKFTVESTIEILPRVEIMRRRAVKTYSRRYRPRAASARIGPPSTEFDSIRSYSHGDPLKTVNWKATARMADGRSLMVNRYEKEGLSTSLLVLDRNAYMKKGTLEVNPFESGIRLILSLSRLLLERSVNTGFWYGQKYSSQRGYVQPATDIENFQRIKRTLIVGEPLESMMTVIDPGKGFYHTLSNTAANVLFVTSLSSYNSTIVNFFIRAISRKSGYSYILDILPYGAIASYKNSEVARLFGSQVMRKSVSRIYGQLPRNAKIVTWDPMEEKLGSVVGLLANYLR